MAAAAAMRLPPRMGRKEIYLPNFTLTLLRTPKLPSTFASFIVPLNINKLDLRDYLYNCYGLRVRGVRSFIQLQKLRQDKPGAIRPAPRRWFRPRSIKKMLVELEKPFVWPEEPQDFDSWDQKTYKSVKEYQEKMRDSMSPDSNEKPTGDRESIAEQAKILLRGEAKWKPMRDVWEDIGGEKEVETDITLPRY